MAYVNKDIKVLLEKIKTRNEFTFEHLRIKQIQVITELMNKKGNVANNA